MSTNQISLGNWMYHTTPIDMDSSFLEENKPIFSEFVAPKEDTTLPIQNVLVLSLGSSTSFSASSSTVPIDIAPSSTQDITTGTQPLSNNTPVSISILPPLCTGVSSTPVGSLSNLPSRAVRLNEIAWMGTTGSYTNEWMELYNTTSSSYSLAHAQLIASSSKSLFSIRFGDSDVIPPFGYFLLERTNDTSVPNIVADKIYTGALTDEGEVIELFDSGCNSVDRVDFKNDFPVVSKNTDRRSMELKQDGFFGLYEGDVDGVSGIFGTPKRQNSIPIQISFTTTSTGSLVDVSNFSASTSTSDVASSTTTSTNEIVEIVASSTPSSTNDGVVATSTVDTQNASSSDSISSFASSTELVASSTVVVAPPLYSNIIISEILFNPIGSDKGKEFVELYNPFDTEQNLKGWALRLLKTGATSTTSLATFGDSSSDTVIVSQHGFLLVGLNSYDAANFGGVTANVRRSSVLPNGEDGVSVILLDANKTEVDRVTYTAQAITKEGQSLERNTQGIFVIQETPQPQFRSF
ncbi:MAG: lamin tail domain-containing protein [Parcubacteria group bacterium]|nr:lamin tail domain-containing protein [Parcubacteria group bacterium]